MEDKLSRPGYRQYIQKRADGSVWRVEETAYNVHGLLLHKYGKNSPEEKVNFLLDLFLQGDAVAETRKRLVDYLKNSQQQKLPVYWTKDDREHHPSRALCHLVLTLPEFQLD